MMLPEETKKNVINLILRRLTIISDKVFQRRVWIEGVGPECDSFDDAVCDIIPQVEAVLEEREQFALTPVQYEILSNFQNKFQQFSDDYDFPELFIDTPEWDEITKMAKEVLKVFNYQPKK